MSNIALLMKTGKTVFSIDDLKKILHTSNEQSIRNYVSRLGKKAILQKLHYGIRGFPSYNIFELACKVKKNSYVSFESVLKQAGVIFQYYEKTVFLASDNTGKRQTKDVQVIYRKIKNNILLNPLGIIHEKGYMIASVERAICDMIYLKNDYYFDSLAGISFEKLENISQIYNKRVILTIKKIIKNAR